METINNMASAAATAIWGNPENKQEPVSGKSGDVSKGEPYDAGNVEHREHADTSTEPTATTHNYKPTTSPTTKSSQPELPTSHDIQQEVDRKQQQQQQQQQPAENDSSEGDSSKPPSINPTMVKDSSTAVGDSTQAQNDVRNPSDPDTRHENAAAKENVDDSTGGPDVGDNPDKLLDSPGPRPLEEVAKEHGGDAGAIGKKDAPKGQDADDNSGLPREDSHGSGTGELYIKSSGLEADGGDFDASAPGAGREADRILDEKGVHKDGPNGSIVSNNNNNNNTSATSSEDSLPKKHHHQPATAANGSAVASGNAAPKEKTSLKTKIKNKLHIHQSSPST